MTRERIAVLRDELEGTRQQAELASGAAALSEKVGANTSVPDEPATTLDDSHTSTAPSTRSDTARERTPQTDHRVHVEFDGQDYQLVVSVAPEQPGHVYVRPLIGGPRRLVSASTVKLLGFVGGRGGCQSD